MMHFKIVVIADDAFEMTYILVDCADDAFPREYIPTVFDNYSVIAMYKRQ
jgi:hypothetical protein